MERIGVPSRLEAILIAAHAFQMLKILIAVVQKDLLALLNVPGRFYHDLGKSDPQPLVQFEMLRLAVVVAAVVDEPRVVSHRPGVYRHGVARRVDVLGEALRMIF